MAFVRGWEWNRTGTGVRGVDLCDDQLVWDHEHWPVMEIGRAHV